MTDRRRARSLATSAIAAGQPTASFEELYREASRGEAIVPWDNRVVNPLLARWLDEHADTLARGAALDVGCGTGDNAYELARRGFDALGVDVSPTAIAVAQSRFSHARLSFEAADVLELPAEFSRKFALVVEIYTLQVLPPEARARAARTIADCVAPEGTLVVIARAREPAEPEGELPFPLLRSEIEAISDDTLECVAIETLWDDESPPVRRFVATFRRSPAASSLSVQS